MKDKFQNVSPHYLGIRGKNYFRNHFGASVHAGRLLQVEYFRTFCDADFVLLDFGCNDGLFLRNLPAKRRIGIEVNVDALNRCREVCTHEGFYIELYSTLEEVESESVDIIISNHCLEHVPNPYGALFEMLRVLKPGGRFALMLPFDDWRNPQYRQWRPDDIDNHFYTWSPMNIGNLLTDVGFVMDSVLLVTSAWSPKFLRFRKFLPVAIFEVICRFFAMLRNRRQVFCLANKAIIAPSTLK